MRRRGEASTGLDLARMFLVLAITFLVLRARLDAQKSEDALRLSAILRRSPGAHLSKRARVERVPALRRRSRLRRRRNLLGVGVAVVEPAKEAPPAPPPNPPGTSAGTPRVSPIAHPSILSMRPYHACVSSALSRASTRRRSARSRQSSARKTPFARVASSSSNAARFRRNVSSRSRSRRARRAARFASAARRVDSKAFALAAIASDGRRRSDAETRGERVAGGGGESTRWTFARASRDGGRRRAKEIPARHAWTRRREARSWSRSIARPTSMTRRGGVWSSTGRSRSGRTGRSRRASDGATGAVARRVREGRRGGKSSRLGASHIARSTSTAPRGRYGSWDAEASPVAARIARRVPRSSAVAAVVDSSAQRVRISSNSYRGTRGIVL